MTVLPCSATVAAARPGGRGDAHPAAAGFADLLDQAATPGAGDGRTTGPVPGDLPGTALDDDAKADPADPVAAGSPTAPVPVPPVLRAAAPAPAAAAERPASAAGAGEAAPGDVRPPTVRAEDAPAPAAPAPQLPAGRPAHHGRVPVTELVPAGPSATPAATPLTAAPVSAAEHPGLGLAGGLLRVPAHVPTGTRLAGPVPAPVPTLLAAAATAATTTPAAAAGGGTDPGAAGTAPPQAPPVLRGPVPPPHLHASADTFDVLAPQAAPMPTPAASAAPPGQAAPAAPALPVAAPAPVPSPAPSPAVSTTPPPTSAPAPLAPALGALAQQALRTGGPTRVVLRLDPPELGSVQVTLAVRARGVHVQLVADDLAAAGALSARRPEVRSALESLGLDLSGWDVSGGEPGAGQGRPEDRPAAQPGGEDGRHPAREPRSPYRREQARVRAEALADAQRHPPSRTSSGVFL